MPVALLGLLKYLLIALIWLFFLFALRAVWAEMRRQVRVTSSARVLASAAPSTQAPLAEEPKRRRGSRSGGIVLLALAGPYAGRTFRIDEEGVLGRDANAEVSMSDDSFISSRHARMFRDGRRVMIEDLGSRNGTLLNDELVQGQSRVTPGDTVQVGQSSFRVVSV
ncbi:MAG: FHA domain-containing protein [Ferrimicrobium sp.]